VGNVNSANFTGSNISVCRAAGAGDIPNWGEAEVETGCEQCRMVVIPPKDLSVCDTVFEKGSQMIDLNVQVSAGSGGPYFYEWVSNSGSGSGTLAQGGPLNPITLQLPVSAALPLERDYVEEITITVTDTKANTNKTIKVKYTIERCITLPPCCNRVSRIVVANNPDSNCENGGSNGKLVFKQNDVKCGTGESGDNPVCSVIWKNSNNEAIGNSSEIDGLPSGIYYAEITCDNECSRTEKIILEEKPYNTARAAGVLATYYKSTAGECKFLSENIIPPSSQIPAVMDFDWTKTPLSVNGLYSIRWTGYIKPACTGDYTFYKTSGLPGRLYIMKSINDMPVINTAENQGTIHLEAGMSYPFIYELTDYVPSQKLKLEWQSESCNLAREVIPSCVLTPDELSNNGVITPTGCFPDTICLTNPEICCNPPVSKHLQEQIDICEKNDRKILLNAFSEGAVSYKWSNEKTTPSIEVDPVSASYSVIITSWCGATVVKHISIRALDDISVEILPEEGETVYACSGASIPLKATGGVSYKWSPSDYLDNPDIANPTATAQSSTTYTVSITTQGGCVMHKQVRVEIASPFELEVNKPVISGCKGENVPLSVLGADSYRWHPEDGVSCRDCPDTWYSISGNDTLYVYGKKDNCVIEKQIPVYQIPNEIKLSYAKAGCAISFEAIGDREAGFGKFHWKFGDKTVIETNERRITHTYSQYGLYHVCLETENSCGEKAYDCQYIEISESECSCKDSNALCN
jgi:hypothetical protein